MREPAFIEDDAVFSPRADGGAQPLTLEDILPLLVSPDSKEPVRKRDGQESLVSAAGEAFPLFQGLPILMPARALPYYHDGRLSLSLNEAEDPFLQYLLMSSIKQNYGPANCNGTDVWYQRHLHRAQTLLDDANGLFLDVGCDSPAVSRALLPAGVRYVGLDPMYSDTDEFRVIGAAEFLPFAEGCFDCVAFTTSLDHVMDYHLAVDEALRVLKPGGTLYVSTLVWTHNAELFRDSVHFHHFRPYQIEGLLAGLHPETQSYYRWKRDPHRYGLYASFRKSTP